jgi:hypothetical protein
MIVPAAAPLRISTVWAAPAPAPATSGRKIAFSRLAMKPIGSEASRVIAPA